MAGGWSGSAGGEVDVVAGRHWEGRIIFQLPGDTCDILLLKVACG